MSRARLNIWLRYEDCSLITDCWRTDLVINTCAGAPLVDMDPTLIDQLKERYPDYADIRAHDYVGEKRIMLYPGNGRHLYHVELDVPPGCYVVWTRVCYGGNEETNKVMVLVRCGDDACVNLILNAVQTCVRQVVNPLLERGVLADVPLHDLEVAARVLMRVGDIPKEQLVAEHGERLELVRMREPRMQKVTARILDMIKGLPE